MARVRLFTGQQLEAIAKVIGDTETGPKGSEIGHILASAGIKDVFPDSTKWIRLYNARVEDQDTTQMRDQSDHASDGADPIHHQPRAVQATADGPESGPRDVRDETG
ncbi:hypothetical protein [Luteitalea sp.]